MKKIIIIATVAMLVSCRENENITQEKNVLQIVDKAIKPKSLPGTSNLIDVKQGISLLDKVMGKYEKPAQLFSVLSNTLSIVKGNSGTIIFINPNDLATENGNPMGKTIDVELKELLSTKELLTSNAQTSSDGRLLVSGGAYYINMTSNGQQLKIKKGSGLKVEFPKITNKTMSLFNGERDSLGLMNWKVSNTDFKSVAQQLPQERSDTTKGSQQNREGSFYVARNVLQPYNSITNYLKSDSCMTNLSPKEKEKIREEIRLNEKIYEAVKLSSFGWINCDRFLNIQEKTDLYVSLNPADSIRYAYLYLVFIDINSVMQLYCFTNDKAAETSFRNIPVGRRVTLVAYSIKDNQIFTCSKELMIEPKTNLTLKFEKTTEDQFKNLLTGS